MNMKIMMEGKYVYTGGDTDVYRSEIKWLIHFLSKLKYDNELNDIDLDKIKLSDILKLI